MFEPKVTREEFTKFEDSICKNFASLDIFLSRELKDIKNQLADLKPKIFNEDNYKTHKQLLSDRNEKEAILSQTVFSERVAAERLDASNRILEGARASKQAIIDEAYKEIEKIKSDLKEENFRLKTELNFTTKEIQNLKKEIDSQEHYIRLRKDFEQDLIKKRDASFKDYEEIIARIRRAYDSRNRAVARYRFLYLKEKKKNEVKPIQVEVKDLIALNTLNENPLIIVNE